MTKLFLSLAFPVLLLAKNSFSHCQIPCGIYDDSLRIELIQEHITTVEKSMIEITKLSIKENAHLNQIIRWVNNKELHVAKIQTIINEYFLQQRIKPKAIGDDHYNQYIQNIKLLHQLSVYAMKAKQVVDLKIVSTMRQTLQEFANSYFHLYNH